MTVEPYQIKKNTSNLQFVGMNNVIDPAMLDWNSGEILDGVNVDLNNSGGFVTRKRRLEALPSIDSVVIGNITYTASTQDITITPINTPVSDRYEDSQFDAYISGGDIIEYYRGRLYRAGMLDGVAVVVCSKPMEFDKVDLRTYLVYTSEEEITMVGSVDDGIYIGNRSEVMYLSGTDVEEGFIARQAIPSGVIKGTRCRSNADRAVVSKMSGTIIIFASYKGVYIGGNGGNVLNLSWNKVSYDYGLAGRAFIREENGLIHYVFQPDVGAGVDNIYSEPNIDKEVYDF